MMKTSAIYLFMALLGFSSGLYGMRSSYGSSSEELEAIDMSGEALEKSFRAKPMVNDGSPQGLFNQGRYLELIKELKEPVALKEYTDGGKNNALHLLAQSGDETLMGQLVDALGSRTSEVINAKNNKGQSVLSYALLFGQKGIIEQLLALVPQGVDIESKDKRDRTPLFYAVERDSRDYEGLTMMLIDAGAELCSKDAGQRTPLLSAARDGGFRVVRELLESDTKKQYPCIDLRMKDDDGYALLHYIAANDLHPKSRLIELIESHVTDKKAFDELKNELNKETNQTPLDFAESFLLSAKDPDEKEYREKKVKQLINLGFRRNA